MRLLTPEFISLVHHIELNKAGWWDKTMQRIIIAILLDSIDNLSLHDIITVLKEQFSINIQLNTLQEHIDILVNDSAIFKANNDTFRLTQDRRNIVADETSKFIILENKVKEQFRFLVTSHCPSLDVDELWTNMINNLISPLLAEMGARTYELLSQSVTRIDTSTSFSDFLSQFSVEFQHGIRMLVIDFTKPSNHYVRSYILGRLNAYFSVQASNLDKRTIASITNASERSLCFRLFIDTNFLFSVLKLHDNPSNDAAASLMSLIKQLKNHLQVELYVASITVEEMRETLVSQIENIRDICSHKRLCEIVTDAALSGIVRNYAKANIASGYTLNPETYFAPYIDDLTTVIKSYGILIHKDPFDDLRKARSVIDDLNDQLDYEKKVHHERPKKYAQLLHDIMLWHFIKKRRRPSVESPLDAVYWIITIDYRFMGYDAHKRRSSSLKVPMTVHPTTLIQMLQFWVPRSDELEMALLESFRLPLFFQEFDSEAEKTTIKILNTLARYATIDDLSVEALTPIVLNQGLRSKIADIEDEIQKRQLVEEAFIEVHRLTLEELEESKRIESQLSDNVSRSATLINELRTELSQVHAEVKKQNLTRVRRSFALNYILLPCILYIIIFVTSQHYTAIKALFNVYDIICVLLIIFVLHVNVLCRKGIKNEELRTWPIVMFIDKFKRSILLVIILGIVGNLASKIVENSSFSKYFGTKPPAVIENHSDKQELQEKGSRDKIGD